MNNDLDQMTKAQLAARAAELGVAVPSGATKAAIRLRIEAAAAPAPVAEPVEPAEDTAVVEQLAEIAADAAEHADVTPAEAAAEIVAQLTGDPDPSDTRTAAERLRDERNAWVARKRAQRRADRDLDSYPFG